MSRGDLTEEGWNVLASLLPAERGRGGRPAGDNRTYVNGMLGVLRTGAPWRDLPEKYGHGNSVYRRHLRWRDRGVWESVLAALTDAREDETSYSLDSTIVRGHAQAAGAKGGLQKRRLVVRGEASPVKCMRSQMPEAGRSSSPHGRGSGRRHRIRNADRSGGTPATGASGRPRLGQQRHSQRSEKTRHQVGHSAAFKPENAPPL